MATINLMRNVDLEKLICMVALLVSVLTACTTVEYQQAEGRSGGYSSREINANTVSVNFRFRTANEAVVEDYVIYRCAEITRLKGFTSFRIKEGSATKRTSTSYAPDSSSTYVIEMFNGPLPVSELHADTPRAYIAYRAMTVIKNRRPELPVPAPLTVAEEALLSVVTRRNPRPDASNWIGPAAIGDVNAVPGLGEAGRNAYQRFLRVQLPRAFVINTNGLGYLETGNNPRNPQDAKDPVERAMAACQKRNVGTCEVYAVNNEVVWRPQ
jgi:hypothetical protein